MLSRNEVNLCTVSRIAGILREDNSKELLAEVRGRSLRDVEMIVSRHRPERLASDRVRPVYIMRPVAELEAAGGAGASVGGDGSALPENGVTSAGGRRFTASAGGKKPATCGDGGSMDLEGTPRDSAYKNLNRVTFEKGYKLEFTVDPRFMEKIGRTRAILSARYPRGLGLGELFEILLDEYIDRHSAEGRIRRRKKREAKKKGRGIPDPQLQKREKSRNRHVSKTIKSQERMEKSKYRNISKPQGSIKKSQHKHTSGQRERTHQESMKQLRNRHAPEILQPKQSTEKSQHKNISGPHERAQQKKSPEKRANTKKVHQIGRANNKRGDSKKKSRIIPRSVRDEIFARDGGRCTFVGSDGVRCNSKRNLQIDHIVPYSKGGDNSAANLRLLCARHNRFEAERVYGREFMEQFYKRE